MKPGQWGWSFDELRLSWQAAEDAGFDLLSCFDHVTAAPAGLAAWDAPALLVAMAGVTSRTRLAVHVLNASLRHPYLLASELAVAQAASEGRVEVGLGTGSYHLARFDHGAIGLPFPSFDARVARLEVCCEVFPRLWRGETVDEPRLGLTEVSLGPIAVEPPPIVVGGAGGRVMEVAARHADAWNSVWSATREDLGQFAEHSRRLDQLCAKTGRERPIQRQVQIWARDLVPTEGRGQIEQFADAGADTLVLVLDEERGADEIRRLADRVLGVAP